MRHLQLGVSPRCCYLPLSVLVTVTNSQASVERGGRAINVPGNMTLMTADLPALIVEAVRAGNVRLSS
jgi:hypothetical protein